MAATLQPQREEIQMTRIATKAAVFVAMFTPAILSAEEVEMAGMKSELPEGWKAEKPEGSMRLAQFNVPAAEGDDADAEVVVFLLRGSGTVEQNFERQKAKFEAPKGGELEAKTSEIKVGPIDAAMQDISGTYLDKFPPFAPNPKVTKRENYRQLYVVFTGKDGGEYYVWLQGPAKTVEQNKEAFETWLKNFK
jgi:hypothetical protein